MTTINQPLQTSGKTPSKTGILLTSLAVAALMAGAVGGGAAFIIFHEFSLKPEDAGKFKMVQGEEPAELATAARNDSTDSRPSTAPMLRRVAAESSDHSDYRYADNTILAPEAARRVIAAWTSNPLLPRTPGPLSQADTEVPNVTSTAPAQETVVVAPALVPAPEVRVATAIPVRPAIPVTAEDVDSTAGNNLAVVDDTQNFPIRRAEPAAAGRSFDAANYLASQDNVPVARAQAVNPTSRAAGYRHDFRLPDVEHQY